MKVVTLVLRFDSADGDVGVEGEIETSQGVSMPFSGWLGLLVLLEGVESAASASEHDGGHLT